MNLEAVLTSNGIALALLFVLLLSVRSGAKKQLFDDRIFELILMLAIIGCICEVGGFLVDGQPGFSSRILVQVFNSFVFTTFPILGYLWNLFINYRIYPNATRGKATDWLLIPLYLNTLIGLVSCFYPIFFTIDQNNVYHRSYWGLFTLALTIFYLVYSFFRINRARKRGHRYLVLPIMRLYLTLAIGIIIQLFWYGSSLVWAALAIALVATYLGVLDEQASIDHLSNLYSRNYLDSYLSKHELDYNCSIVGIMIDIDHFKCINDTQGHLQGDKVIRDVGHLIHLAVDYSDFAARYGGDEFIIFREAKNIEAGKEIIRKLEEEFKKYNNDKVEAQKISFSYGIALYHPQNNTVDKFLKEMDTVMYQNKRSKAKILPERRCQ